MFAVPLHEPTAQHEVHEGARVAKKETKDVTLSPTSRAQRGKSIAKG